MMYIYTYIRTVRIFKIDVAAPGFHYKCISGRPEQSSGISISKASPLFGDLGMYMYSQRSSEEAFRVFGRNHLILIRSLLVCGEAAPQTNVGKAFRILTSILKTRTICMHLSVTLRIVDSAEECCWFSACRFPAGQSSFICHKVGVKSSTFKIGGRACCASNTCRARAATCRANCK